MTRYISTALAALFAASILAFCAPAPAYAQGFIHCAQLAKDAATLVKVHQLGAKVELPDREYLRLVVALASNAVASNAVASGAPAQYIKQFKAVCEKEQA